MSSRPFGRSDRPVAALSAVAICDAMRIGFLSWLAEFLQRTACLTETSQIVKRRKRNSLTCPPTERRVAAASCEEKIPKGNPSSVDDSSRVHRIGPLTQAVEVLQQGIEATGSGIRVQIDTADLLDQLLQRFQLLQTQQQRVVLHQPCRVEQRPRCR